MAEKQSESESESDDHCISKPVPRPPGSTFDRELISSGGKGIHQNLHEFSEEYQSRDKMMKSMHQLKYPFH